MDSAQKQDYRFKHILSPQIGGKNTREDLPVDVIYIMVAIEELAQENQRKNAAAASAMQPKMNEAAQISVELRNQPLGLNW